MQLSVFHCSRVRVANSHYKDRTFAKATIRREHVLQAQKPVELGGVVAFLTNESAPAMISIGITSDSPKIRIYSCPLRVVDAERFDNPFATALPSGAGVSLRKLRPPCDWLRVAPLTLLVRGSLSASGPVSPGHLK
jgi:hypothetical protein